MLVKSPALLLCLLIAVLTSARATPTDNFLNRGIEMTDGWRWWRSLGPMYAETFPWVYHPRHGWLWLAPSDRAAVHAWSPDLGWLWLDLDAYPWINSSERGWLYHTNADSGGEARFYSRQLNSALQRRGAWVIPAFETRLQALPLSHLSGAAQSQPESVLNSPPTEADWSALAALLPQLDGLDLDDHQAEMQTELERVRQELESILAMNSLTSQAHWDRTAYPRTEAGFRLLAADLGAAANRSTLGLHRALASLEDFDTRWGPLIERFYTVGNALDTMDQRLFRQRERLLGNQLEALRSLSTSVQAQIGDAHYSLDEWETPDVESWRIGESTTTAIAEDAELSARAHRFLAQHTGGMERFEAAHAVLTGVGDAPGISGQYAQLRTQMDAATEVVNTLSALYWNVLSVLEEGGPYRLGDGGGGNSDGSVTISDGSVTVIAVGGDYGYSAHLAEIRDAFSALDEKLDSILPRTQPLLRLENLEHLQQEESLMRDTLAQIEVINDLLALPVPDPVLPWLNWLEISASTP